MPKMQNAELSAIVDSFIQDSVSYNSEYMKENEEYLRRYNQEEYGDEEAGFSSVIASDVRDTVDSDMTSMVRVFLGSGDVMLSRAMGESEEAIKEASEKTSLINHMILRRESSYRTIHGFLKDAEIQKMGVVHYFVDTVRKTREEFKKDLTVEQVTMLIKEIKEEKKVDKVDIVEKEKLDDENKFNFRLRITESKKEFIIKNIATENFLLSRGSTCLEDAQLAGHESYPTRGELVASGMTEEEVSKFPTSDGRSGITGSGQQNSGSGSSQAEAMRDIRWRDEGGDVIDIDGFKQWSTEKVHHVLAFALIDYDGDGIAERRRIVKIGSTIVENETYDHIPYAITSCILEAHKAIGNGRASLVVQDQSVNTELERAMLDNIYDVGNPRSLIGEGVNQDDFFDDKKSGVVRMKPNATQSPRDSIIPLTVPFIGQEVMMVKQSRDQSKASRTGEMLASQGLEADQLHQETATRFSGIERANEAKIELVARNHAEVGFRKLYDGVEWTLRRFIDDVIIVPLNGGKSLEVNPSEWTHETLTISRVGLGAGAGDKAVQQLQGIYGIQKQEQQMGSLLVDDQKIFNTLDQLSQALGHPDVSEFFNNPDIPREVLFAQYQQLTQAMQMAQQQLEELSQSNPLAEAETIKAQASLINAQQKSKVELIKGSTQTELKQMEMIQKKAFHDSDKTYDYTKLEVENNVDIPGEGKNG
ncbi:MAG: portal protein [Candidatus Nezhaarchaeales archaeon]